LAAARYCWRTRASEHLDEARSKLAEVQVILKSEEAEIKHLEDEAPNAGDRTAQVEEAVKRAKSDLEVSTNLEPQRQTTEIEAEQQLRTEQDKLNRLESQLDELVKNMGNRSEQSDRVPRRFLNSKQSGLGTDHRKLMTHYP